MRRRDLEAAAAAAGMKLAPAPRTATLPAARCTEVERDMIEDLARRRGISIAEHIRRRAIAPLTEEERAAAAGERQVSS